jgi:hypothetical protein
MQGDAAAAGTDGLTLRSPETVMRLARMGSFHPTIISFTRTLIRRMAAEKWRFEIAVNDLDAEGYGTYVRHVHTPLGIVGFIAFSDTLDPADRTDRVIAERWDSTFTLTLGAPTKEDIERLRANVPLQEAGRCSAKEIVLSRANKSVRFFEAVVQELAAGRQPSREDIAKVGYLMRTTAVYGNGKFGLGDFENLKRTSLFELPFQAEMLMVYMVREFSLDLADHVAAVRGGDKAVTMAPDRRTCFGVGNATGLGMAPFLINHPRLIDRWMTARETGLARVLAVETAAPAVVKRFHQLLARAIAHVGEWAVPDEVQTQRIADLRGHLARLSEEITGEDLTTWTHPWRRLLDWAIETADLETEELVCSLVLELYPDLVIPLEKDMASPEEERIDGAMSLEDLGELIERNYSWVMEVDFEAQSARALFWYRSAEKEEPRIGQRFEEPGADLEMRLGFGYAVYRLLTTLAGMSPRELEKTNVAQFLMVNPQWRQTVRRVQSLNEAPYGEVRDNVLDAECRPIDLLRCKLSIFGASKFDPKSLLWTRIALFQGAPILSALDSPDVDDWAFPVIASEPGG